MSCVVGLRRYSILKEGLIFGLVPEQKELYTISGILCIYIYIYIGRSIWGRFILVCFVDSQFHCSHCPVEERCGDGWI